MELAWALLLAIALARPETRPVSFLLAAKWGASYFAAYSGWWLAVPSVDLVAAVVFVRASVNLPIHSRKAIAAAFVLALLVHGWHWVLWANNDHVGVQYYWLMLGLFSAKVIALSEPGTSDLVRSGLHWLGGVVRGILARAFPTPYGVRYKHHSRIGRRFARRCVRERTDSAAGR